MPLPTYLMSNFPSVRPSLNLQFDSQPTPADMTSHLASVGATFSRASIGTYTDANGLIQEATSGQARPNYSSAGVHEGLLIEESRTNFIRSSEDFSTTDWNATSGGSITINQIIAPDGKASADLLTSKAGGSNFDRVEHSVSLTSGNDVTFSLFVKQYESDDQVTIRLEGTSLGTAGTDTNSNYKFTFSTETLSKISGGTAKDTFVEDYGNGWYRIGITLDNATITRANIYPKFNSADASNVYIWGAQLEEGSFPTSYIPTIPTFTSRASDGTYFDSSGVLQTASTNVARIDHKYIDGQWVEAGLLLEGQSVNYAKASEDLDNTTYWITSRTTITADTEIDPKGGTNSYLVSETTDTGSHWFGGQSAHAQAVAIGETWTMSVFVKKGDGANAPDIMQLGWGSGGFGSNVYANFNITTNVVTDIGSGLDSAKIEDFEDWKRISITATATANDENAARLFLYFTNNNPNATQNSNYTGQTNANVFVWGAQVEQQSQPTSYIPTTTATVTRSADVYTTATKVRSADVCYIDGTAFTDFYNQEEGTLFTQFESTASIFDPFLFMISDGTGTNRIAIDINDGTEFRARITDGGSTNMNGTYSYSDAEYKLAFKFSTSGSVVIDGTERISDGSTTLPAVDRIHLNSQLGSNVLTSTIKKLIYFPRSLSDNELIKLTQ